MPLSVAMEVNFDQTASADVTSRQPRLQFESEFNFTSDNQIKNRNRRRRKTMENNFCVSSRRWTNLIYCYFTDINSLSLTFLSFYFSLADRLQFMIVNRMTEWSNIFCLNMITSSVREAFNWIICFHVDSFAMTWLKFSVSIIFCFLVGSNDNQIIMKWH